MKEHKQSTVKSVDKVYTKEEILFLAREVSKSLIRALKAQGSSLKQGVIADTTTKSFSVKIEYGEQRGKDTFKFYIEEGTNELYYRSEQGDAYLCEFVIIESNVVQIPSVLLQEKLEKLLVKYLTENLKTAIVGSYIEILKEGRTLKDSTQNILGKFPTVKQALVDLMTKDFSEFISDVHWVAPKPTTFSVILKNGQAFTLKWLGKSFQATVNGKNFNLNYVAEYQQALDQIGNLLQTGIAAEEGEALGVPTTGLDDFSGTSEPFNTPSGTPEPSGEFSDTDFEEEPQT